MSISAKLQQFRDSPRITLNDKFLGDESSPQLCQLLSSHPNLQSLQLKSNSLSPTGLTPIFKSLRCSCFNSLKQLNLQHNSLGSNNYIQWHTQLSRLIQVCTKLVYLNLSNNQINSQGFRLFYPAIVRSNTIMIVELRYNCIQGEDVKGFVRELVDIGNTVLLFVELAGNKLKRDLIDGLDKILSKNRDKNPVTKEKLMANVSYTDYQNDMQRPHNRPQSTGSIPHENMTVYLSQILEQTRQENAQRKIRLESQLSQLQKHQKQESIKIHQLQKHCNQLQILNRNLKFELDRTLTQLQQFQKDQQSHIRIHEQKIRDGTKQLQELQIKFQQMETRINKEHQIKMKEVVRDWEARLRNYQDQIRAVEADNAGLEAEIRKGLERRERLKMEIVDEANAVRTRIQEEEISRFHIKMQNMESRLRELQTTKQGHVYRNQDLVTELEKQSRESVEQIKELQSELQNLKSKQVQFNAKSKDFFAKNEKIKAEIQLKQITIDKLGQQISRLDKQIEQKLANQEDQHTKIKQSIQQTRYQRQTERDAQLTRLNQAQNALRLAQLENSKLRQEYGLLAQKLQVGLSLAVHQVFQENSLY